MALWHIVIGEVRMAGLAMSPECYNLLRVMAAEAEQELKKEPERKDEAEENTRRWTRYMVDEVLRDERDELIALYFSKARETFCPFWPIC